MDTIWSFLSPTRDDSLPVVTAQPADSSTTADHALTGSNRFVPIAPVASALASLDTLEEETQRPDLLSATVYKSSRDASSIGISLTGDAILGVTVRRVDPAGLFGVCCFQPGDKIMSINNKSCQGLDRCGVIDLIEKVENILTVVVRAPNGRADRVSSMVMKESPDASVGLGLKLRDGNLVISSIFEHGIFAHSLLNISDMVLSVNGVACTDAVAARESIQASPSFVTITAVTKHSTGVVVAESTSWGTYVSGVAPATRQGRGVAATRQQGGATATRQNGAANYLGSQGPNGRRPCFPAIVICVPLIVVLGVIILSLTPRQN